MVSSCLPSFRRSIAKFAFATAATATLVFGSGAIARGPQADPAIPTVELTSLPAEAKQTKELVRKGGPFPYAKDGSVFRNREQLLPANARGYYREYTVKTPGARNRGARRIVCGGSQPTQPDACYYTGDHYASFARIVQ